MLPFVYSFFRSKWLPAHRRSVPQLALCISLFSCLCTCSVVYAQAGQISTKKWLEAPIAARQNATEPRVALVTGNTHYGGENELVNPQNDARDIATALQALGFDVLLCYDRTNNEMVNDLNDFADRIKAANANGGKGAVALFYYSGHGMSVKGSNYLVPIGLTPRSETDIEFSALSAERVLSQMEEANSVINVVILDACRSNPFGRSKAIGDKGLAFMQAPSGSFIAYATAPGRTASDTGGEANSIYTQELLKYIKVPSLTIEEVFKRAGRAVKEYSKNNQTPWAESSLYTDFYFRPPTVAVTDDIDTVAQLHISSEITGAKIIVDGTTVTDGKYNKNLGLEKSQEIEVDVIVDGYDPWIKRVKLLRGEIVTLPITITLLHSKGADNSIVSGGVGGHGEAPDIKVTKLTPQEGTGSSALVTAKPDDPNTRKIVSTPVERLDRFTEARILARGKPVITEEMKSSDLKRVRIEFTIAPNGASEYKILSGSGNDAVNTAVLKACSAYRWQGATLGGKPVESKQIMVFDPNE